MDCAQCEQSRQTRRAWHCGHIPRRDWDEKNRAPWPPGYEPPRDDLPEYCTGYLASLHEVREAMQARFWKDSGALSARLRGQEPTGALLDLVEALEVTNGEIMAYEARGD